MKKYYIFVSLSITSHSVFLVANKELLLCKKHIIVPYNRLKEMIISIPTKLKDISNPYSFDQNQYLINPSAHILLNSGSYSIINITSMFESIIKSYPQLRNYYFKNGGLEGALHHPVPMVNYFLRERLVRSVK